MTTDEIKLNVNGEEHVLQVTPDRRLLDVLREDLGLVSVREGCGIGMCGTCTVLADGKAISACLMLASQAQGVEITTIEGISKNGKLHPVQEAFIQHSAFQCAFCTPGFILSTIALLNEHSNPDEETIREYLVGNLCRCGSYLNILEAVKELGELSNDA
jgi:aerobic-type carbon monoxide dehydrogenase small subunit (CoxS/CutS family)